MIETICYTAIYGHYERPKPVETVSVPCVLYTDDPDLRAKGWEVRYAPLDGLTPMLAAKWWKCRPDLAVGGDASIWIDGSITPDEFFVARCLTALGDDDAAFTTHPWRDDIYAEYEASVSASKYDPAQMRAQVAHYRMCGHPRNWGLFASGVMVRRNTPEVIRLLNEPWWAENITWSWQDQLSLPFVVRQAGEALRWNALLPWEKWWSISAHDPVRVS